jgi:hypothetical protein
MAGGWRSVGPLRCYRSAGLRIVQLFGLRLTVTRSSVAFTWARP